MYLTEVQCSPYGKVFLCILYILFTDVFIPFSLPASHLSLSASFANSECKFTEQSSD